jgi:hypothetical protein
MLNLQRGKREVAFSCPRVGPAERRSTFYSDSVDGMRVDRTANGNWRRPRTRTSREVRRVGEKLAPLR